MRLSLPFLPQTVLILLFSAFSCGITCAQVAVADSSSGIIQIVYSSDAHFGIRRTAFQGAREVDAKTVNRRLISRINSIPDALLPEDRGVGAGKKAGAIDYFIESGDLANRQEVPVQTATKSWKQFRNVYLQGLTTRNRQGQPTGFLLLPGNHDVSNAIGYYKKMKPVTDPGSMIGIYNYMLRPAVKKNRANYHYPGDKINYSRDIGGIHWLFINIWPDSANRIWMENDLRQVAADIPVIIVAHDPPDGDAAHFTNPLGDHSINDRDKFENLLEEQYKEVKTEKSGERPQQDKKEQVGFAAFLKAHPNIRAYFHGHNNWNQFYTYQGPDQDLNLPTFRVDSPMKGRKSSKEETSLSFQLISIDPAGHRMTVRECLWDADPANPDSPLVWGDVRSIPL